MNETVRPTRFDKEYPELGTGPIPVQPFISQEYFELERAHLFPNVWLHVGRTEELTEAGSFFVKDLDVPDVSLLIVRDKAGEVRAFHNVCSHRCNRVVRHRAGVAGQFACGFHGWIYGLDGTLVGVPDEQQFFDLERAHYGLTPVACETWQGFIFICLASEPLETLTSFLGDHFRALEGYPFARLQACFSWNTEIGCNWKLAQDAFQETYHVPYVHRHSIADALNDGDNAVTYPIACRLNGYHRKTSVAGNPKTVYGNPKAVNDPNMKTYNNPDKPIGSAALRAGVGGTREQFDAEALPAGMNPARHPNWAFDINGVFPDFYLSLRPNYYQAYNFRPLAVDRTRFEGRVYYPKMETAGGRFYQEYMKCVLRDVLLEDWSNLEVLQRSIASGAKREMVLQDNEILLRHSFHQIDGYINARLIEQAGAERE